MDLNFTPEEEGFRTEVQDFLKDKLPTPLAHKVHAGQRLSKADQQEWHDILNARGWLANHWPEQYGGPGWTGADQIRQRGAKAVLAATHPERRRLVVPGLL